MENSFSSRIHSLQQIHPTLLPLNLTYLEIDHTGFPEYDAVDRVDRAAK